MGSTLVDVEQKQGPSKREVLVTDLAERPPGAGEPRHLVPAWLGGGSARKDGQRGEKEVPSGDVNGNLTKLMGELAGEPTKVEQSR